MQGDAILNLQRLRDDERHAMLEVADKVVGDGKAIAVAAYGSKVAGYARKDSDYDIIVVAEKFPGRVRYHYVDSPITASALVVEEGLLESDARKASLGEFVSGRLLNVYEPLLNGDVLRTAEVESKKRVLAEEILELGSQHGEFAQDLVIPLEYFLFNKLHKRALIYPPALYSYVRTYTCPSRDENKAFTLEGFAEAALSLQTSGILRLEAQEGKEGNVRILGEGLRSRSFASLLSLFNLTTRGMRQYAVHGYAGRVGLNTFKDEALSKVKRMQEKVDPPLEFEEPKRLMGLDEGFVLPKTEQMIERLATLSGLVAYTRRDKSLGEIYSTARLVTLKSGTGKEVRFVFKNFADIRSMKWALLNVWSLSRKFSMSPQARMHREYSASVVLRGKGVATPAIVGAVLDDKVLVKEFIEGERLSDIVQKIQSGRSDETEAVRMFGESMGRIHTAGFALGDSKANNVIVKRGGAEARTPVSDDLYFTDLEQAMDGGDQAWDVAEFVYYQAKLSFKDSGARKVADAFLDGYGKTNGTENILKAMTPKYAAPFRPFTTPQVLRAVRESFNAHAP